jgi:hypothetical protein
VHGVLIVVGLQLAAEALDRQLVVDDRRGAALRPSGIGVALPTTQSWVSGDT